MFGAAAVPIKRNFFRAKNPLRFFRGKKRNGNSVLKAEMAISYSLAVPFVPEASPALVRPARMRSFASDFVSDSIAPFRRFFEYLRHPSLVSMDFRAVKAEVSGKYWKSAAGLLAANLIISEVVSCAGRYAGYLGESFGANGVAAAILLGDHITAFIAGQVFWFISAAVALGATTPRAKLSAFLKIEPEALSMWARGFLATVSFDIYQFFQLAKMYSSMKPGAISTIANGVLIIIGGIGILISLAINADLIARIAEKLSMPERKA